jgi:putative SOS response-associated peptidase YedK
MCGRFTLVRLADLLDVMPGVRLPWVDRTPRYNIAPSQKVLAVANDAPDRVDLLVWGLIPSWAKDPSIGNRMINARAETLAEKPSFRTAYKRHRCLIPADGFYEWRKEPDGRTKTPMYAQVRGGEPFTFGGLWESWTSPDGTEVRSTTIITVEPNELMRTVHDRMPLIISAEDRAKWLDPGEKLPAWLSPLLRPYPAEQMTVRPVSRAVNNPRNDTPECVEPAAT